jgi:hypothetical protein
LKVVNSVVGMVDAMVEYLAERRVVLKVEWKVGHWE